MDIKSLLSRRSRGLAPSPIRKLVPLMRLPGMISFGGGYPHQRTFAFSSLTAKFKSEHEFIVSGPDLDLACQYGPTDGLADLKNLISLWHEHKDNVTLDNSNIVILNGSQEGLHIMAYLFLDEEDWVALSEPAYPGAIGAFRAFTQNFLPIELDEEGMVTKKLEETLAARQSAGLPLPKFIYDVPNGHNPAGVTLSLVRRRHLLEIASRYQILILEDDPYQLLQFDDQPPLPSLQVLDRENLVVRLDSFSKIFAPGLRLGYVSGAPEIMQSVQLYKQGANLHTSAMSQMLLTGFMKTHTPEEFRASIRENCFFYQQNRDTFVQAAKKHLPSWVSFRVPSAGLFVWFALPAEFDCAKIVEEYGKELGILMVPGPAFSTRGGLRNCLRASFSMVTPAEIEEGMIRFAKMLARGG